ncbi:MAG: hypothetical protein WA323_28260 [Candidatus Nitrosopolaris sp.]
MIPPTNEEGRNTILLFIHSSQNMASRKISLGCLVVISFSSKAVNLYGKENTVAAKTSGVVIQSLMLDSAGKTHATV